MFWFFDGAWFYFVQTSAFSLTTWIVPQMFASTRSVIYGSYVKHDGLRWTAFSLPRTPLSAFHRTINHLHSQYHQVFSGTLVAIILLGRLWALACFLLNVSFRILGCKIWKSSKGLAAAVAVLTAALIGITPMPSHAADSSDTTK